MLLLPSTSFLLLFQPLPTYLPFHLGSFGDPALCYPSLSFLLPTHHYLFPPTYQVYLAAQVLGNAACTQKLLWRGTGRWAHSSRRRKKMVKVTWEWWVKEQRWGAERQEVGAEVHLAVVKTECPNFDHLTMGSLQQRYLQGQTISTIHSAPL